MVERQSIGLENVCNVRELEGYPIGERHIRRGLHLRSGRLNGVSDRDIQILSEKYRLGAVADLLMAAEQENILTVPSSARCITLFLSWSLEMRDSWKETVF